MPRRKITQNPFNSNLEREIFLDCNCRQCFGAECCFMFKETILFDNKKSMSVKTFYICKRFNTEGKLCYYKRKGNMKKTIENFVKKWTLTNIEDYGSETSPSYRKFENEFKKLLSDMSEKTPFSLYQFNENHSDFSAVMKSESGRFYYISISDVRYFPNEWHYKILYRTMAHDKDWRGGQNRYTRLEELVKNLKWLEQNEKEK